MHASPKVLNSGRPPGPSFFELQNESLDDEAYANLEYPLKLSKQYGDLIYIAAAKQYFVTGPEGFQHILKTNAKNYIKKNYFYNRLHFLFGMSVLTGDGPFWKHRRRIAQPAFHATFIKNYVPSILSGVQDFIVQHSGRNESLKAETSSVNVLTLMNRLTLDIALLLFTKEKAPLDELEKLGEAIFFTNWYVSHSLFIAPWKPTLNNIRFYRHMKIMDSILLSYIQKRRQQQAPVDSDKMDLLDCLIEAQDETGTRSLTDGEVLNEFRTLLLTGHETTGCALTWLLFLLAEHPEWQETLAQELHEVLQGRLPTLEDLPSLPILNAIFQETLRLYPPIWSSARKSLEADELYGYKIPKNSLIVLHLYALHRNPRVWDKPNEFHPERFLAKNAVHHTPFSFLPFSTGPRTCIASQLGTQETLLITAALAQHFRFGKTKKTKFRVETCISLRPRNGMWLKIIPKVL